MLDRKNKKNRIFRFIKKALVALKFLVKIMIWTSFRLNALIFSKLLLVGGQVFGTSNILISYLSLCVINGFSPTPFSRQKLLQFS